MGGMSLPRRASAHLIYHERLLDDIVADFEDDRLRAGGVGDRSRVTPSRASRGVRNSRARERARGCCRARRGKVGVLTHRDDDRADDERDAGRAAEARRDRRDRFGSVSALAHGWIAARGKRALGERGRGRERARGRAESLGGFAANTNGVGSMARAMARAAPPRDPRRAAEARRIPPPTFFGSRRCALGVGYTISCVGYTSSVLAPLYLPLPRHQNTRHYVTRLVSP